MKLRWFVEWKATEDATRIATMSDVVEHQTHSVANEMAQEAIRLQVFFVEHEGWIVIQTGTREE